MARSGSDTDSDAPPRKKLKSDAPMVPSASRNGSTILLESQSQSQDVEMSPAGNGRPKRTASKKSNLKESSAEEDDADDEPPPPPKKPHAKKASTSDAMPKRGKKAAAATNGEDDEAAPTPAKRGRKAKAKEEDAPLPVRVQSAWRVGAHVSAAGGVENAVLNAAKIGAGAFALFLKSQRKWVSPPLKPANITAFKTAMQTHGYEPQDVLPHGSYLLNLGNPDAAKREQSYECFLDDLKRCEQLGLLLYNFHPGSTVGACTLAESCATIAASLNRAHRATARVVTVLENMAGQGNVVGSRFEDLRDIIAGVEDKRRVGVCLDTCHMFAAGYDIRTKEAYEKTMAEFDAVVGREYLRGMHLNDSKGALGCKKDRHENLGVGQLGLAPFAHIVRDARARGVPLVLETPNEDDPGVWAVEVGVLHALVGDAGAGAGQSSAGVTSASGADASVSVRETVEKVSAAVGFEASGVPVPAPSSAEPTAPADGVAAIAPGVAHLPADAVAPASVPTPPELTPARAAELVQRVKDAVAKASAGKKKPAAAGKKVPAKRGRGRKKAESDDDDEEDGEEGHEHGDDD